MLYRALIRPALFSVDPERAHDCATGLLRWAGRVPTAKTWLSLRFDYADPSLELSLFGLEFRNPVGLAAGFDKNCELFGVLPCFGFGFVECGTVTAQAQPGNPKPRMVRLPAEQALINRLGFNNQGAEAIARRLKDAAPPRVPLGLNIGKSKVVPLERAIQDYLFSFERLYPFADYFTVNVSSPNTPGLRDLQHKLTPLLWALQEKNRALGGGRMKPLFVKLAPDLSPAELDASAQCAAQNRATGVIAGNTTLSREGVNLARPEEGGLSGRPLERRSTDMVRQLYRNFGKDLAVIGAGGIFTAEDAYRKIKAGASLVQLYTGWIYGGPAAVRRINRGLAELLRRDGIKNVLDAVGAEA